MNVAERMERMVSGKLLREFVRDRAWVANSYIAGRTTYDKDDARSSKITPVRFMYSDTSLGANIAMNPLPQFTETADIPVQGLVKFKDSKGMGRWYGENIENNRRLISIRAGVPQFLGSIEFFTGFYNADMSYLARTGRERGVVTSIIHSISQVVGFIIPLVALPILALNMFGNLVNYLSMTPKHKYYYLKPAMPSYWLTVTTIVNMIAVNRGMLPRIYDETNPGIGGKLKDTYRFTAEDNQKIRELLGDDVMFKDGGINVYAVSTRAQRIARRAYAQMEKVINQHIEMKVRGVDSQRAAYLALEKIYDGETILDINGDSNLTDTREGQSVSGFAAYLSKWFSSEYGKDLTGKDDSKASASSETVVSAKPENESILEKTWEYLKTEWDDGSSFVTFRVDTDGQSQESFTNQVGESSIAVSLNGKSGESRSTRFSLSDGQVFADGSIQQGVIDAVTSGVGAVLSGVAEGMGASGLGILTGAAYVDIPKHWQSSSAQLPRMNYTMTLTSPYNNVYSQMFNIYVPLAMLLALALPQSTGAYSYTSPRLCELYDRGRAQSRLCIVDSLSITRGIHNLPFDRNGNAMGIDVSISFMDMSSIMHAPVTQDWGINPFSEALFDTDSAFADYMAVLSSLSLHENIHMTEKTRIIYNRWRLGLENTFFNNSARFAQVMANLPGLRLAQVFMEGVQNR